jgi:hypothetical protein
MLSAWHMYVVMLVHSALASKQHVKYTALRRYAW